MARTKKVLAKSTAPRPVSSVLDILGKGKPVLTNVSMEDTSCVNCGKNIPAVRLDALKMLGTPRTQWTHTSCSTTSKIKGIYMGEVGTSKLQLCDKIYNDSVRSVFKKATAVDGDNDDDEETEPEGKDSR